MRRFPGIAIDDPEDLIDRPPVRRFQGPTRQVFRHLIEEGHGAALVGGYHGIADGIQRDLSALLFHVQGIRDGRTFDHVADRLRQQVVVEAALQQIVLGAAMHGQFGNALPGGINQQEYGYLRRGAEQAVKGADAVAVRQKHIGDDGIHLSGRGIRQSPQSFCQGP